MALRGSKTLKLHLHILKVKRYFFPKKQLILNKFLVLLNHLVSARKQVTVNFYVIFITDQCKLQYITSEIHSFVNYVKLRYKKVVLIK